VHVSVGAGISRSELRFAGETDATLNQSSAAATLEYRVSPKVALMVGGGAVLGGTMRAAGNTYDVQPGWLATVGMSDRIVDGYGRAPFVLLSVSIAQSFVRTSLADAPSVSLKATDVRVGATIGRTLGPITPFLAARVFGGPVFWTLAGEDVSGTDRAHYQLGVGCSIAIGSSFDAFAEWDYLGERRFAAGVGWSF